MKRSLEERVLNLEISNLYRSVTRRLIEIYDEQHTRALPHKKKRIRKNVSPDSRYMPISQAAALAGFSRDSMLRYALKEELGIGYTKINGRWFIERASLLAFLDRVKIQKKRGRGRPGRPRFYDGEE